MTKRTWRGSSRWLLLGSLALNLFFVGVAVAIGVRAPATPAWDREVFIRIERLAATLPRPDAALLRTQFEAHRDAIENAQSAYYTAQDTIHKTLRQNPFDIGAMRAAMAKTREARQDFDLVIQGIFAAAVEHMSPAGRHALADRTPSS